MLGQGFENGSGAWSAESAKKSTNTAPDMH